MSKKNQFFKDINNIPNKLCLFRLVVILVSVGCFLCGLPVMGAFIGLVAGITDKLDGIIARKYNMCTELGSLLDQISDLLFNFFVISAAVYMGCWPIWILFLWGFRDLSVLCMRASAGQLGFAIHSSQLGRVATFEMFCAHFFMPLDWALNSKDYMFADFVQAHFHPYFCIGMHWFALLAILVGIGMQYVTAGKYIKDYVHKYGEIFDKSEDKSENESEGLNESDAETAETAASDNAEKA